MADKEEKEKLTEALKEYFGEDVGDIECCYGEDLQEPGRRITIITKPHKPTFKEKLVTNHNQAKILARLVKEVGTNNYNGGYADGRAEQAFEDGKKMGELLKGGTAR
ncbi:hypothetical protein [Lactobacillus crispatus]|uniref:hypothetical protein n=1 Tax=Lactobacillus crispatus TaxID=47770 RepID=UPI001F09CF65|nr:hypothetical protein [Lactobacillus crispatus]